MISIGTVDRVFEKYSAQARLIKRELRKKTKIADEIFASV